MFYLGDILIDRLVGGYAENIAGDKTLYYLSQLQDATIEITSQTREYTDKDGNLVYKKYYGKAGTLNANNAFLNAAIMAASAGTEAVNATAEAPIDMPKFIVVNKGDTVTIKDAVEGTIHVVALFKDGTRGEQFTLADSASATAFAFSADTGALTLPTVSDEAGYTQFLVKYTRTVDKGIAITNSAEKYPEMVRLTLKALRRDICTNELKACYIEIPKFQVSPDTSVSLQSEQQQMAYTGDLITDYCDGEKTLYRFFEAEEDIED